MFQDDNPNKTIRVHADTNSSPAPRIEMVRGTHDTWGSGDNYNDWRFSNENDLIFYSGTSSISSGAAVERLKLYSDGSGLEINNAYKLPGADGSANQVLQTDGNGALSFATISGGGTDTNTFVITGEEGDLYAGTGSTGNANGYQFSYGNGRANVQNSSSGTDFGINVPVDCTLTRVDVVFGNNGNVSTGTTTFVVVKNGTNQSGNLSTNHSSGVHDTHHTGLSHSFSAGDRFNLRTTTASKQVGPMRMTAYFTPT